MNGTPRVTGWLRLASALVLCLGLSGTAAAAAASDGRAPSGALAVVQTHLVAATSSAQSAAIRGGIELRHAVTKHRPPATASALVVAAVVLTGLAAVTVQRRRTDPDVAHLAFTRGARAPPVVTGI